MFVRLLNVLDGLIDGSQPLPAPHPQRISFPRNLQIRRRLAAALARRLLVSGIILNEEESRHLLFKVASHLCRAGQVGDPAMALLEFNRVWPALEFTLRSNKGWLTSRGGVPWTVDAYNAWLANFAKSVRSRYGAPPRLGQLMGYPGFYLAELTTGAHVYSEGVALGHCMAWSVNDAVMTKHGHKELSSPESFECLTYAIKVRTGELRLFSLRDDGGSSVGTLAYAPKNRKIVESRFKSGICEFPNVWSRFRCAMAKTMSELVELDHEPMHGGCLRSCSLAGWCEQHIKFESDAPMPEGPGRVPT